MQRRHHAPIRRTAIALLAAALLAASLAVTACARRPSAVRPKSTATEAWRTSEASVGTTSSDAGSGTAAEEETAAPAAPPTVGRLPEIDVPPPHTFAMADKGSAAVGSYAIAFRPFGRGPVTDGTATLVIYVDRAEPHGVGGGKPFPFERRNVLVRLSPATQAAIPGAGRYRGILELRVENDVLVPWLTDVAAR